LASQIQQLTQLPGLVTADIASRLNRYGDLIDELIKTLPGNENGPPDSFKDDSMVNSIATTEIALVSCVNAMTQIVSTSPINADEGGLQTRKQAIETALGVKLKFSDLTAALDNSQGQLEDKRIGDQYFAQNKTYQLSKEGLTLTTNYLLSFSFDLKIERRFTLQKDRAPIEITITEYNDINKLDLFTESNKLKGNEFNIIRAGREIVIYD